MAHAVCLHYCIRQHGGVRCGQTLPMSWIGSKGLTRSDRAPGRSGSYTHTAHTHTQGTDKGGSLDKFPKATIG